MRLLNNIKLSTVVLIAALCCVGTISTSCILSEKIDVEILYTPQLHARFAVEKSIVEIRNARVFVYSPSGLLLRDTSFTAEQLHSATPLIIVKGVNAGEYRMVSFANVDQMTFTGNQIGVSTLENLDVSLPEVASQDDPAPIEIDSLCHSIVPFFVSRGNPTVSTVELGEAHYFVTVTVNGLDRLTVPVGELGIQLIDVPHSLGAVANVVGRFDIDVDLNQKSTDEFYGQCMSLMFKTADNVKLRVMEDGKSIQTLTLQPERYFELATPANRLNIVVQFYANSYVILVNNWKLGEFELINVGG